MSGRRQDGRPIRGRLFFLNFQFGSKDCRGRGGNRDVTRFRAAVAVEYFRSVTGGDNLGEGGEWRADDVDAANEFIGTTIRENLVNDQRLNLESLRLTTPSKSEAAGDVVDQKAVRLVLLFDEFNELGAKLRVGHGLGAFDDEITLARNGHRAHLTTAMTVRVGETDEWR